MDIRAQASFTFRSPPETLWEHIGDPAKHGAWSAKAPLEVTKVGDEPIGVGTEFHSSSKFLGKPVEATLRITAYDPPKRIAFEAVHPEGTYEHELTLEQREGGTTVTRVVMIPAGSGLRKLLARTIAPTAIAKEAVKAFQRLRDQAEG